MAGIMAIQIGELMMRTAAIGLLCLLALVPTAAFADSITSITPASFFQNDTEQFATLQGTGLEGNVSTQIVLSGPAGTVEVGASGGSGDGTVLYLNIPDSALSLPGTVSVTVKAIDANGTRSLWLDFRARLDDRSVHGNRCA